MIGQNKKSVMYTPGTGGLGGYLTGNVDDNGYTFVNPKNVVSFSSDLYNDPFTNTANTLFNSKKPTISRSLPSVIPTNSSNTWSQGASGFIDNSPEWGTEEFFNTYDTLGGDDSVMNQFKEASNNQQGFDWGGLFGDEHMMGNITGLAGTVMQAASLPAMLKNAKLQNEALKQNIAFAKQDQDAHYKSRNSFNNFKMPQTSAFA